MSSTIVMSTHPTPIYVLGDSHALEFNMRLYETDDDRQFLFLSAYAPGLTAAACAGSDGELSRALAGALTRSGLLVKAGGREQAFHRTDDPHWSHVALVQGRPRTQPAVAISIGGLDIVHFGVGLAETDDIALPPELVEPSGPLSGDPAPGALPFGEAVRLFGERLQPLEQGLRELRADGFERLALLSLAPPTPHDGAFRAVRADLGLTETPSHASLAWRTKCALVANAALSAVAARSGVTFVDRWPDQVRGGVALPGLLTDWMHLTGWAADATATALIDVFERGTPHAPQAPPAYFQVYLQDLRSGSGVSEYTVGQADFDALRAASPETLVALHDVNERTTIWVNTARVMGAVELPLTRA